MSLQDELIKIEVEIDSNSDRIADDFKNTSESASKMYGEIARLEKAMAFLKTTGKENSEQFKSFQGRLKEVKTELHSTEGKLAKLSKVSDISAMSAFQLKKRMSDLRKEMDVTSKSLDSEKWNKLNSEFIATRDRLREVNAGTKETSKAMEVFQNALPIGSANLMVKTVEKIINGIKQFARDAVEQTQIVGDKWGMFTAGMTTAYQQFVAQISTGNWGNLFRNIAEAYRAGREIQALTDELFEMNNSLSIEAAKLTRENKEQERILKDVTKSEKERLAAGQKIIENENRILEIKKDIAKQELEAAVKGLETRTRMSEEDRQYFIDNYNGNRAAIKQAEQLADLEKRRQQIIMGLATSTAPDPIANEKINSLNAQISSARSNPETVKAYDIMKKYNLANDPLVEAYVKATEKLINADTEFYQATMKTATRTAALRKEISEDSKNAAEKAYQDELALAARKSREETNQLKKQYSSGALTKEQYNTRMTAATQDLYMKQIEIAMRYGKDTSELEGKLYDAAITKHEEFQKAIAAGNKEMFKELMKELDAGIRNLARETDKELQEMGDSVINDDMQEFLAKLRAADTINRESGSSQDRLAAAENDFDMEMASLEELHEMQLVSEEAYQQRKKEITEKYILECAKIQTKAWQDSLQTALTFVNGVANLASSLQEAEMTSLDARMQAELTAAGDNADERARIEENYEAQKLEIQKKYADVNMGIQIAQAVASAALAMVQAWNAAGGQPAVAAIIMALIGASTAIQIAAMVAQRNAIQNSSVSSSSSSTSNRVVTSGGFSEGGYTGDGGRLEPAGIVHRGEYVVPVPEMRNPAVLSRVRDIEAIRTQRTSAHRLPGYAEGGYTSGPSGAQDTNALLVQAINGLRANPLKAYVVLSEIQSQQELENRFKTAASRS